MSSMKTYSTMQLLRQRYMMPAFVLLEEVRNGTGYAKALRSADAVVLSAWPSRGVWMAGFEVKSSRQDWQRELDDPAKAAAFFDYCDYWWLVAGDENIVRPGELPKTWGLLVVKGGKLVMVTDAPKNEHVKPIDRLMLASMFRNFAEHYVPAGRVSEMAEDIAKTKKDSVVKTLEYNVDHARKEVESLRKAITDFEQASGVSISQYNGTHVGEAFKKFTGFGGLEGIERQLDRVRRELQGIVKTIDDTLKKD